MFNFKYNILVFFQILFNLTNAFLLVKVFGVSPQTDAYFILQTIFAAVYLIQFMPIEQFMYFYNDAKVESRESAEKFYNFSIFVALLTGFLSVIFFLFFQNGIIKIFAYKLDFERLQLLNIYVSKYKWVLFFTPISYICSSLLTAEMKIGYPYVITIIPVFFIVLTQIFCHLISYKDISLLIYAGLFGTILSALLNIFLVIKNFNYKFSLDFKHRLSSKYIKNSIMIRAGHNIHNFLFPLVTNNFLSSFPAGFVSYFYYAQKMVNVLQNIITGPSNRILQAKISRSCSLNDLKNIKNDIRYYFKIFSPIFITSAIITYYFLPYALNLISSGKLNTEDINYIQSIFIFLSVWSVILFLEAPFDMVLVAVKNSGIFILVNALYIIDYSILLILFKNKYNLNAVGIAIIFSQLISFFLYSKTALKLLNSNQKNLIKFMFKYLKGKLYTYDGI